MRSRLLPLLALLAACAPSRIPNTEVPDTKENRAVYEVIKQYGEALRKKDAAAILLLVAPDYYDVSGTPDPSDDVTRETLEKFLASDLGKVEGVMLDMGVKKIEVNGDEARAEVYYDAAYRVVTPGGPVPKRPSDINQMRFKRVGGAWKITAGL
jgi:ketosteroid isomerase-like protein